MLLILRLLGKALRLCCLLLHILIWLLLVDALISLIDLIILFEWHLLLIWRWPHHLLLLMLMLLRRKIWLLHGIRHPRCLYRNLLKWFLIVRYLLIVLILLSILISLCHLIIYICRFIICYFIWRFWAFAVRIFGIFHI